MENVLINVSGMSCEHCVKSITDAVGALDGINSISVSLNEKTVNVKFNSSFVTLKLIIDTIEEQGFDVDNYSQFN